MRWRGDACEVTPVSEGGGHQRAGREVLSGSRRFVDSRATIPPNGSRPAASHHPLAFNPDAVTVDLRWLTLGYGIKFASLMMVIVMIVIAIVARE